MVKYEEGKWKILDKEVTITNRGIEEKHYTDDIKYFEEMESKHEHIKIINTAAIEISEKMEERLNEVSFIVPSYQAEVAEYIETGNITVEKGHPLYEFMESKRKNQELIDLWDTILFGGVE